MTPFFGARRILVVDDDYVAREVLNAALEDDYTIIKAESGREALDIVNSATPPDLVLLDIMMPDLDGYEVCRLIKGNPETKEIPVIFVTALSREEDETRGFEIGGVDYITKPVNPVTVKVRVRTHMELKLQRDRMEELVAIRTDELRKSMAKVAARDSLVRDLFEAMDEMLANRDHYTFVHAIRVAEISKRIAQQMGLDDSDVEAIELGCLVHDIGKIAIPDDVLLKPGRFDREDRLIMELHPTIGAKFFTKRLQDNRLIDIILHHHERLDGSGYPNQLKNGQISRHVRIVSVADVYEALIAQRPYKQPMTREKALSILWEDTAAGKMEKEAVQALVAVTESWSPLEIKREFGASYTETLELFRRKTYFKEPLSDFFNYRFLLSMDRSNVLRKTWEHYHLMMVDFVKLRECNQRLGYVKADHILNEIGVRLHDILQSVINDHELESDAIMLFRKGADYLIYSDCEDVFLSDLEKQIRKFLQEVETEHNLKARVLSREYKMKHPVEDALNELFVPPAAPVRTQEGLAQPQPSARRSPPSFS